MKGLLVYLSAMSLFVYIRIFLDKRDITNLEMALIAGSVILITTSLVLAEKMNLHFPPTLAWAYVGIVLGGIGVGCLFYLL